MGKGKAGPRIPTESLERHTVLCTLSCRQREHEGWKSEGSVQSDPGAVCTDLPDLPPAFGLSSLPLLAIVLTCGLVLNKGLVFSVLFVLLRKAWASGEPNPGKQPNPPSRS